MLKISNILLIITLIIHWIYSEYRYNKLINEFKKQNYATLNVVIKPIENTSIVSQNDSIISYSDSVLSLRINKYTNTIKYRIKIDTIKVNIQLTPKGINILPYDTTRAKINIINTTNSEYNQENNMKIALSTTLPDRLSFMLLYRRIVAGLSMQYISNSIKLSPIVGVYIDL